MERPSLDLGICETPPRPSSPQLPFAALGPGSYCRAWHCRLSTSNCSVTELNNQLVHLPHSPLPIRSQYPTTPPTRCTSAGPHTRQQASSAPNQRHLKHPTMSFLGGAECSTAGNPLSQFTKHVQDDKSLQRDRLVGRGPGGMESMRSQMGAPQDAVGTRVDSPLQHGAD